MRLALIVAALTALSVPAYAGFMDIGGNWKSGPIVLDPEVECAPDTLGVSITESSNKVTIEVEADSDDLLEATLAMGEDGQVFVEESGWMSRFGIGDETTRDALIQNEPVVWARETNTGAVLYRTRISKPGGLELLRISLEPVDGALTATVALTSDACTFDAFTTALTAQ